MAIWQASTACGGSRALAPPDYGQRGACLWCPRHERSWLAHPWNERPHWHPLPCGMLFLALGLAKAGGVGSWIEVKLVRCDRCEREEEKEEETRC